eukprot:5648198-Alexandrium_andersonii.AAC.1
MCQALLRYASSACMGGLEGGRIEGPGGKLKGMAQAVCAEVELRAELPRVVCADLNADLAMIPAVAQR